MTLILLLSVCLLVKMIFVILVGCKLSAIRILVIVLDIAQVIRLTVTVFNLRYG